MEFQVKRNDLLQELNLAIGVVEKKRTIPILANVLLDVADQYLAITATDQELLIRCGCAIQSSDSGSITVPSSKVFEIVRVIALIELTYDNKIILGGYFTVKDFAAYIVFFFARTVFSIITCSRNHI